MENEAHEARSRWPLLGMIDPRKVEVSTTRRSPGSAPGSGAATSGIADTGRAGEAAPGAVASSGGGPSARDRSQAALRRSAPLFARSPRRDMAQVPEKPIPAAPESGAFRFSPPPGTQASPEEIAPPVPEETVAAPPVARESVAAPGNVGVPPVLLVPPVAPTIPPTVAPPTPVPATASAGTPLRKLFGAATEPDMPHAQPPTTSVQPADAEGRLDRLFGRLREGESTNDTSTTSNTKPAQGGGADPESASAPIRPGLSRE